MIPLNRFLLKSSQCSIVLAPLATNSLVNNIKLQQLRGARNGVQRIFRKRLPMYKKTLTNLPPLTELLTEPEIQTNLEDTINIRRKKLEVYKEYLPADSNNNYIEALFHEDSNDVDRVLKIIAENLETLNSFHIAVSFEALDDLMTSKLADPSTILVAPEFMQLCKKTLYKVRFFESDEVLKLVKCLSNVGVAEDTLLVQAVFQMARHHINDFTYVELETLLRHLEKFVEIQEGNKSLLVALKNIIPRAKERQLKEELYHKLESSSSVKA